MTKILNKILNKIIFYLYIYKPKFGKNTVILTKKKNFGSEPYLVEIGDNCLITAGTKFITHDGSISVYKKYIDDMSMDLVYGKYNIFGKIMIGNNVFIGINTIVLPNISIGDNVIIGAGSVITKDIEANSVYAGNPAKYICSIDEYCSKLNHKDIVFVNNSKLVLRMKEIKNKFQMN